MAKYDGKMKNKIRFLDHLLNNTCNDENSLVIEKMFPHIKVETPVRKNVGCCFNGICIEWFSFSVENKLVLHQLRYMIGLKNSRHFSSNQKWTQTQSWLHLHSFSRALLQLHVMTSSFDWLTGLSASFVIGQSIYFWTENHSNIKEGEKYLKLYYKQCS